VRGDQRETLAAPHCQTDRPEATLDVDGYVDGLWTTREVLVIAHVDNPVNIFFMIAKTPFELGV
ncbi:MAG: hypothetical protein ABI137_02880, partial [Antricoccus sp.]